MAQMLEPGQMHGGLRIVSHLSEGAKAVTFRAEDSDGRPRLVKQFHSPGTALKWFGDFVQHQERIHARLARSSAPGRFVTMERQWVQEPFGLLQVFEYFEGCLDLDAVMPDGAEPEDGSTRLVRARSLVASVARMHDVGVSHLDLKPANVLLRRDPALRTGGELLLIDFDFAIQEGSPIPWPERWGFVGTAGYQSPEHYRGGAAPGAHSDVFTLAIMLHELLGRGRPWADAADDDDRKRRMLAGERPPFVVEDAVRAQIDASRLGRLLESALSPSAGGRPSASELHAALLSGPQVGEHVARRHRSWPASVATSPSERHAPSPVAAPPARSSIAAHKLLLESGCGKRIAIEAPLIFGYRRLLTAGVDAAGAASREQLHFRREPGGAWTVTPCFAARGRVSINGTPLSAESAARLHVGDRIELEGHGMRCLLKVVPHG